MTWIRRYVGVLFGVTWPFQQTLMQHVFCCTPPRTEIDYCQGWSCMIFDSTVLVSELFTFSTYELTGMRKGTSFLYFYVYYWSVFTWPPRMERVLHFASFTLNFTNIFCLHSMHLAAFNILSLWLGYVDLWSIIWCCMFLYCLFRHLLHIFHLNWQEWEEVLIYSLLCSLSKCL